MCIIYSRKKVLLELPNRARKVGYNRKDYKLNAEL